jgi:hypothetical protein
MPPNGEPVWLGPSGDTEAFFLRPDAQAGRFPVVIFTHGNGELIDHWLPEFLYLPKHGVGALLVEFPGYGRSGGSPSETSITEAILAAYDWVANAPGVDRRRIVAYGRSLGGGAACALSRERKLAALILESSFTSIPDMAPFFVPGVLLADKFDNLSAVREFEGPVLVLHGMHDAIIPIAHGEALAAAAGGAVQALPCGHNDCPRAWPLITSFLDDRLPPRDTVH